MKEVLLNLIRERTNKVSLATEMIREKFGDVKFAVMNRFGDRIPKRGFLDAAESVSYNFHGRGVRVNFGDEEINFDFNFSNRRAENHAGFNHWRVEEFLSDHRAEYEELNDLSIEEIQSLLENLALENRIVFDETENLYYLPNDLKKEIENKIREKEMALL